MDTTSLRSWTILIELGSFIILILKGTFFSGQFKYEAENLK